MPSVWSIVGQVLLFTVIGGVAGRLGAVDPWWVLTPLAVPFGIIFAAIDAAETDEDEALAKEMYAVEPPEQAAIWLSDLSAGKKLDFDRFVLSELGIETSAQRGSRVLMRWTDVSHIRAANASAKGVRVARSVSVRAGDDEVSLRCAQEHRGSLLALCRIMVASAEDVNAQVRRDLPSFARGPFWVRTDRR